MTVYVDKLRMWGSWKYGTSCHLLPGGLSAEDIEELHAMAKQIGMRRAWFQEERWPHYDLTAIRRPRALAAGCVEISTKAWMKKVKPAAMPAAAHT